MNAPRLEPIGLTEREQDHSEMMDALARAVSETLAEQRITHALKGGSALRMCYELERPSDDLDFETLTYTNANEVVRDAIAKMPEWERADDPDLAPGWFKMRHRPSGREHPTKIDLITAGAFPGQSREMPRDRLAIVNGVHTFGIEELGKKKLATIIGEVPREQARDIYDVAWLVENHARAIDTDDLRKLRKWNDSVTGNEGKWARLKQRFEENLTTKRVRFSQTMQVIANNVVRELGRRADERGPSQAAEELAREYQRTREAGGGRETAAERVARAHAARRAHWANTAHDQDRGRE